MLQKASKKKVCVLGFSTCCSICPADRACFQASWGRAENTVASLQPLSLASRQQMVCPHLCCQTPADGSCCYPSEAHTIVSSCSIPSLWSTACLCFLFHSCAGLPVCVEDQFKVRKKVAHLVLGTSSGQGPDRGPRLTAWWWRYEDRYSSWPASSDQGLLAHKQVVDMPRTKQQVSCGSY